MKKLNNKGFTLVELLAVIIILAIVVGITIPAVMTTVSSARTKAFETAAQTTADWFERQYQAAQIGDSSIAGVNEKYTELVNSAKATEDNYTKDKTTTITDFKSSESSELIQAAGLKSTNVEKIYVKFNNEGRACVYLLAKTTGDYNNSGTLRANTSTTGKGNFMKGGSC